MNTLIISLAPVLIIAVYVYFRDKYDKEPLSLLLQSLLVGLLISIPVIIIERRLMNYGSYLSGIWEPAFRAFIVAGGTEEVFKFLGLYYLIWRNKNFNEKFDGIVYAVFISLGFAGIENILYVSSGGAQVGLARAFTAVPAHAIFGIVMGYYFGLARFEPANRLKHLRRALLSAILIHGTYDFILMAEIPLLLSLFIPFLALMYFYGLKKMAKIDQNGEI